MLDDLVLARKTGAGALKRSVQVALGIRTGRRSSTSARLPARAPRERFLTGLWRRGLIGEDLEVICADVGRGLIAVLPIVYPPIHQPFCCPAVATSL